MKEYEYIVIGIIWIVSCAFSFHIGGIVEESHWQKREAANNATYAAKLKAADDRIAESEHQHALNLAAADADYQRRLRDNANTKDHTIADLRNRVISLSIPAICPPSGNATTNAATSTSIGNGETRAKLSDAAAEFLIGEANRADAIVLQLNQCQQIIADDRATH